MPNPFKIAKDYMTDPAKAKCRGWTQVDKVWFSTEPLYDSATDLYARLTYKGALAVCKRLNASLPSMADIKRLHDDAAKGLALELDPVELPDADLQKKGNVKPADINLYRDANSGGREWAEYHDDQVKEQLDKLDWDEEMRLANCGKHWIAGAPTGRAYLMGWWKGKKFTQEGTSSGPGPHFDQFHDYGTLTLVVTKTKPDDDDS